MSKLTKKEIINETVDYFSKNNRAFGSECGCVYNNPHNEHCAVGRCLLPSLQGLGEGLPGNDLGVERMVSENNACDLDELLQPKYRGHSEGFWRRIQGFHDNDDYWDGTEGLSLWGEEQLTEMLKRYDTNE